MLLSEDIGMKVKDRKMSEKSEFNVDVKEKILVLVILLLCKEKILYWFVSKLGIKKVERTNEDKRCRVFLDFCKSKFVIGKK